MRHAAAWHWSGAPERTETPPEPRDVSYLKPSAEREFFRIESNNERAMPAQKRTTPGTPGEVIWRAWGMNVHDRADQRYQLNRRSDEENSHRGCERPLCRTTIVQPGKPEHALARRTVVAGRVIAWRGVPIRGIGIFRRTRLVTAMVAATGLSTRNHCPLDAL